MSSPHWLTRFDPDDGEPYGVVCWCEIDSPHLGNGDLFPEPDDEENES